MRLLELEPRWIEHEGRRIGFIFISPCQRKRHDGTVNPKPYRLTCLAEKVPMGLQRAIAEQMYGDDDYTIVPCNPQQQWTIAGGIDAATFEAMTVTPSIDASASGHWHGYITGGEVK